MVFYLSIARLRPMEATDFYIMKDVDSRRRVIPVRRLRRRQPRRGAVLPLPREAGRAIAGAVRQKRPTTTERRSFFASALGVVAADARCSGQYYLTGCDPALRRAGCDAALEGAYVGRRLMASRLVARGAPLGVPNF